MLDMGVVPIVLLGTEEARPILASAKELAGRLMSPCKLCPLDWADEDDRELWNGLLKSLDVRTLQDAMRAIDDRPKPWGPAIRMMLNGDIAYRIPPGFGFSLPRIEIRRSDLPIISEPRFETRDHPDTIFSPSMVQRDVCELFNLKESKADAISFLPSLGIMPKRYFREQVEAERARILSHTELARRFSTTWQKVSDRLNSARVECTAGNYFDREAAIAVLTAARRH